ncbi:MAG: hypothetical protein DMG01_29570 [Acidobacteria bacterium]|nr:MAG: hypothetical protein DMG01_29570 [Acidobacteriota bacterium]
MTEQLKAFLKFLALNRNASPHTVRAYESDLAQFIDHAAALAGVRRADVKPAHLDRTALRSFLADLHKRRRSRATAARKLAAARTLIRYLRREDEIEGDPGAMVSTPKREIRMPAHLSESEMDALLGAPRDPRAVLRVRAPSQRADRPRRGGREPERANGPRVREGPQAAARPIQHDDDEGDSGVSQRPGANRQRSSQ